MLNHINSLKSNESQKNKLWFLSYLAENSRKIAWVLWLSFLAWTWIVYINKTDNEQNNEWVVSEIVVANKSEKEKVEEWFVMAKVNKKWIWVEEYMKINWMNWSFQNLVNKRTWERVINPNKDLILWEVYILASDEKFAERLSVLIKHRNETRLAQINWKSDSKIDNSWEINKTDEIKDDWHVAVASNSKQNTSAESVLQYKSLIEAKIANSIVSDYDSRIKQIFSNAWEIGWSKELLKMVSSVESSNWRFLDTYEKAVKSDNSKHRAIYVEKALREIVNWDNDIWVFQITPDWVDTEIKNWAIVDWIIIRNLSTLKSKVRSVLINSAIKWLSKEELLEKLALVDVRFDIVQMWKVVQKSFLRIYDNLWRYNLSWKDRLKLALWAYNKWEWWAYNSAKTWKIWISNDLWKRLKHIETSTIENSWKLASNDNIYGKVSLEEAKRDKVVVVKATLTVRQEIAKVVANDRTISADVRKSVVDVLDKDFIRIQRSIDFYLEKYRNWNTEEKAKSRVMLAKLKVFMDQHNKKRDEEILRIANQNQTPLKKVA